MTHVCTECGNITQWYYDGAPNCGDPRCVPTPEYHDNVQIDDFHTPPTRIPDKLQNTDVIKNDEKSEDDIDGRDNDQDINDEDILNDDTNPTHDYIFKFDEDELN